MSEITKKLTFDVTPLQHRRLKESSKTLNITQQELVGIIIDLTLTNLEGIKPHVQRYLQKKMAEENKRKELEKKAQELIAKLSDEQMADLLAGRLL